MTRADSIVIVLAATLLSWLYVNYWGGTRPGDSFQVIIGDQPSKNFSLDHDHTIRISGKLGDSVIEVKDHKIRFVDSPCAAKLCIQRGWLSDAGDTAACLPNRVLLQVAGNARHYDAINF